MKSITITPDTTNSFGRKYVVKGIDSIRIMAAGGELALFVHDRLHLRADESSDNDLFAGMKTIKEYLENYFFITVQIAGK